MKYLSDWGITINIEFVERKYEAIFIFMCKFCLTVCLISLANRTIRNKALKTAENNINQGGLYGFP
jgi:hypothetical protein